MQAFSASTPVDRGAKVQERFDDHSITASLDSGSYSESANTFDTSWENGTVFS